MTDTPNLSSSYGPDGQVDLVSVVMPARNAAHVIVDQVCALMLQDYERPWELLIVDNGSTDATAQVVATALSGPRHPSLKLVEVLFLKEPHGYATPRNFGISHSQGDLVALCDADDLVEEGWLTALVAASRDCPFLASHQLPYERSAEGDAQPDLPVKFGVSVAHTGGSAFRREVFDALGGFDPLFDSGGEDVDFALRARHQLGIEPSLVPEARYRVRPRSSARGAFRQGYRNGSSQVRLYCRHAPSAGIAPSPAFMVPRRLYRLMRSLPRLCRSAHRHGWFLMAGVYTGRFVWSIGLRAAWF